MTESNESYPYEIDKRRELYNRASDSAYSIWFTYNRNYVAAEWVGRFGWVLDFFSAIVGVVLLYVLTRSEEPGFIILNQLSNFAAADLAIILLVSSLLSAFYGPKLRSRDYYTSGQEMQELYDEIIDYIELELQDPEKNIDDLVESYKRFNAKRHQINQSTPQLGGHWYRMMKWKQKYKKTVPWEEYSDWEGPDFQLKAEGDSYIWNSSTE